MTRRRRIVRSVGPNRSDDESLPPALSRREWLRLAGAGAAVGLLASHTAAAQQRALPPRCIVRPEQTEGPYFLDERLERSDIRADAGAGSIAAGVPLELTFRVSGIAGERCAPLRGAIVDVWQCDVLGVYSGFADANGYFDTRERSFLRGYQVTGEDGTARFTTIYPGWYPGRTVHIHFKIRTDPTAGRRAVTSQLYFDDALTDAVHAREPYAAKGRRRVTNANDGIFRRGGRELMLPVVAQADGYAGAFDIGLRL